MTLLRDASKVEQMEFGRRVRAVRAFAGLDRAQLTRYVPDVSATTIKRLETGEPVKGSIASWSARLEAAVGVPCRHFLETGEWSFARAPEPITPVVDLELARQLVGSLDRVLGGRDHEAERMTAALEKYGSHLGTCPALEGWKAEDWPDGPECTCGFSAAKRSPYDPMSEAA
jgi:hypothetical protein